MTSLPFEILEMENLYSKKNPFALCQFKGMCASILLLSLHIEINFANHQRGNSCWCQIEREICIQHKSPLTTYMVHYIFMQIKLTKKPYLINSLNNLLFWLVGNRSVLCLTDRLYF